MRMLLIVLLAVAGVIAARVGVEYYANQVQLDVAAATGATIQEQARELGFDASSIQYKVDGRKISLASTPESDLVAAQRDALIAALEAQPSIGKINADGVTVASPNEEIDVAVLRTPGFAPIVFPKRELGNIEPAAAIAAGSTEGRCLALNADLADVSVKFDSTATYIYRKYRSELASLVNDLNACAGLYRLSIAGHTDFTASEKYNQQLSEMRADRVAAFLRESGSKITIQTKGYGDTQPVANNRKVEGRAQNRRADLMLVPLK